VPGHVPDIVRRYFQLDPQQAEAFVALFSAEATVIDERQTYSGTEEIRAWREGPATKYTYTTEIFGTEALGGDRYLATGRLSGDFPGATADLGWEFTVAGDLISRLVIAP
jgi:hypothetical protein